MDLEAAEVGSRARRLGDPRFQRQLFLEVGLLAVAEGDVLALEQLDEDLDEARVELLAGDPPQLLDRLVAGDRRAVGVARGHHVVGVGDGDDPRQLGDRVPFEAARIALAVDPLVVGEDDLGDRPVAVQRGDHARALLRMAADQHPVFVGQRHVRLEDPVGEDELADVVQQRGDVDQLLLAARVAGALRDRPRVTGDGGAVAGGHLVAQIERAQHRAQHPDLEAGELLGAGLELLGPLLGQQQGAEQVLEGDQHDAEQGDPGDADLVVDEGDADRHQRRRQLGGQHRDQDVANLGEEGAALQIAFIEADHREVDRQRQQEGREDERVEGGVRRRDPEPAGRLVEGDAADQREGGVGEDVVEQVVRRVAPARPADQDRQDPDHRGRRAAEQDHRQDEGEEAAGGLQAGGGFDRGQVAEDREAEQDAEQRQVPVGGAAPQDGGGDDGGEQHHLQEDDQPCRSRCWHGVARSCPRPRRGARESSVRKRGSLRLKTTGHLRYRVARTKVDGRGIRNKASNPIDQELANCVKASGIDL